jgi:magnesium transporter
MISIPFFPEKKQIHNVKHKTTEVRVIEYNGLKWIDIVKPTKKEIEQLEKEYDFHELLLEDCLTEHQRSKVDDYDDYCFIVLHFPRYRKELVRLDSEEVDIFVGPNYLITLHEGELKPLVSLSRMCQTREETRKDYLGEGSALLLYEIVRRLFDYCFPMLDKIGLMLDEINTEVFSNRKREMVEKVSRAKMQIINYRRIIKPLRPVILTLERVITRFLPEDMEMYFDDITDRAEKISDLLENYKEVIESLGTTYEVLTSHRINNLMRVFTVIQAVSLPMLLTSGLFGMNVLGIPTGENPHGFWIVVALTFGLMGIVAVSMTMKRNRWF